MITYLTAIGGGTFPTLTGEALRALMQADVIYGWERTLKDLPEDVTENRVPIKDSAELFEQLKRDEAAREPSIETAVVVYSGDTGFYSGARLLLPKLKEAGMKAEVIPGVSSIQILAARLGRPWQDWNLVSAHGVSCDPVAEVMKGKSTCFLTGGKVGVVDLCKTLTNAGLGNLSAVLAEDLTYETENLSFGTVRSLVDRE
ncbi:MAG: precorrin-6y C5,15-methyltransferase (decarboxylating) subunit CbiE, partial [Clostridia bacterium]|nr:precorrin-6y C5,15-methyltransferase (decarboxylating) subunit CbiE [Clostridia bacterium]